MCLSHLLIHTGDATRLLFLPSFLPRSFSSRPITSQESAVKFCPLPSAISSLSLSLVVASLIFLLAASSSFGQVTIKERVEIAGEAHARVNSVANASSAGAPVAPFDGVVRVSFYGPAHRFLVPFTTSDSVTILLNGVEKSRTAVLEHYALNSSILSNCGGNGTYYGYTVPGTTSTWLPIQVSEGDTLDFADGVGQALYAQQSDSVWDSSLEATCNGNVYYSRIPFGVEVVRDSLQLEFITAPGDTLPEPGTLITARAIVRGANGSGAVRFEIENHDYPGGVPDTLIWFLVGNDTLATPQDLSMNVDTAEVTLISTTYWGAVDVTAKYYVGTDTLHEKTKRWPEDEDADGIADRWELASENGGSLTLPDTNGTPVANDAGWDWEMTTQFTNHHHGDGITKLQEYQGVMIGSEHYRLSPAVKEVFVDTLEAEYAVWAAQELESQLFVKAFTVAGIIGPGGTQSSFFPGTNQLKWLGENEATFANYRNYVKVKDDGHFRKHPRVNVDSLRNGIIVAAGRYWTGLRVTDPACTSNPYCAPQDTINGVQYGLTQSPIYTIMKGEKAAYSRIFDATINGLLDVSINSIPEATPLHYFFYPIADGRDTAWVSVYNGTDIDGGGFGLVNPLDLLSVAPPNDFVDAHSGGQDIDDIRQMTTLHELGHALGLGPRNTHDNTSPSPMVEGHGPDNVSTFRPKDKQQFRLK